MSTSPAETTVLLVAAGTTRCALPIASVVETMRALPLRPFAGVAPYVRGASVIRGEAVPVVDLAALLGGPSANAARLVVVRAGERKAALAVDRVIGVERLDTRAMAEVPPLLSSVASQAVASLGSQDAELLAVLRTSHLVPDDVWMSLAERDNR